MMNYDDQQYHRERERHCRSMADLASDPEVRSRHETLAELHAGRVANFDGFSDSDADPDLI